MFRLVTVALLAAGLQAATVRGVVVDNQTGRPVGRATVVAQPIAGTAGAAESAVTDVNGAFELPPIAAGAWLIVANRRGFAPSPYGKEPVRVAASTELRLSIRLRRFGAITGTVVDENDVALQDQDVLAYRNVRPFAIAARAKTDDRGQYRIGGLVPGSYLVRTAARDADDGMFVPTWAREARIVQESRPVRVDYDGEAARTDLRPYPGSLFSLDGFVNPGRSATVTLSTDTGPVTTATDTRGRFRLPPVAPGPYEVLAFTRDLAAWERVSVYYRIGPRRLDLVPYPTVSLRPDDAALPLLIRRRDLAGPGPTEAFRGPERALLPGRYEFSLAPLPNVYLVSISGFDPDPTGWIEIPVTGSMELKIVLSTHPAAVRGIVRNAAGEPVPGAPVYLGELRTVRTDTQGRFEFYGLAPGWYHLLASFEDEIPTAANSRRVQLAEGQDLTEDLVLHTAQ
jgi:protocatechuate 3,4-dioxygenase beta subunit